MFTISYLHVLVVMIDLEAFYLNKYRSSSYYVYFCCINTFFTLCYCCSWKTCFMHEHANSTLLLQVYETCDCVLKRRKFCAAIVILRWKMKFLTSLLFKSTSVPINHNVSIIFSPLTTNFSIIAPVPFVKS